MLGIVLVRTLGLVALLWLLRWGGALRLGCGITGISVPLRLFGKLYPWR